MRIESIKNVFNENFIFIYPYDNRKDLMITVYPDGRMQWPSIGMANLEKSKKFIAAMKAALKIAGKINKHKFYQWS